MNAYNNMILPGSRVNGSNNISNVPNAGKPPVDSGFGDIFAQQIDAQITPGVQFSKHANMRLNNREINLSDDQLKRIESGVDTAKQKGIQDSLVLVDDIALVVNVRSRTVVTALNNSSQNVFTNIDGAVIV